MTPAQMASKGDKPLSPAFIHVRQTDIRAYLNQDTKNSNFEQPKATGGMTIAYYLAKAFTEGDAPVQAVYVFAGVARCDDRDVYSKKIGRRLAMQRLAEDPLYFPLTFDMSLAQPIEGADPMFVFIHERDYPVIENVIEDVKACLRKGTDWKSKGLLFKTPAT